MKCGRFPPKIDQCFLLKLLSKVTINPNYLFYLSKSFVFPKSFKGGYAILFGFLFLLTLPLSAEGFLKAKGENIVDASGKPYLIRSMGIGAWMVMEPYMFNMKEEPRLGQHQMFNVFRSLVGEEDLQVFHKAWLNNFFTEADVIRAKSLRFNTLRPALHYNLFTLPIEKEPQVGKDTWLPEGFALLDSLVAWCARHKIYVILDLHAAPGGQGYDGNINDYDPTKKSLWESEENQRKTVALWEKFAQRYANNPWVGGYDLLNEPNYSFENKNPGGCDDISNKPLKILYEQIIQAVRKYDTQHLIYLEGNCWAKNFNGWWPLSISDSNLVLSFHKYWDENNYNSISKYIDLRKKYQIPLWMSEAGENNNDWYKYAVKLLEDNNIGWSWWTWKKGNDNRGTFTIKYPAGFWDIINYSKGGPKPDANKSRIALMELAEASKLENCNYNKETVDALMAFNTTPLLPQRNMTTTRSIQTRRLNTSQILFSDFSKNTSIEHKSRNTEYYNLLGIKQGSITD